MTDRIVAVSIGVLMSLFIGSFTVHADTASELNGKTALLAGDSITYGYLDSASAPRSWAYRLQQNYGMIVSNKGQNGHSLSDVRNYTAYGNADKRLHVKCFDTATYDYVILQGGVNDVIGAEDGKGHPNPGVAVPVGSVAATKNPADFDTTTFAGGLERYFYEATTRYPSARIGFIITYQTPNSTWGGNTKNADAYWAIARDICDKWDISYLDLYDDAYSYDVLKANTNTYLQDTLHLNAAGYDVITPYIAAWIATLEPYNRHESRSPSVTEFVPSTTADVFKTVTKSDSSETIASTTPSGALTSAGDIAVVSSAENSVPDGKDRPNYSFLIIVLSIGAVLVASIVIVAAINGKIQ